MPPRNCERNSASKSEQSADALGTARIILGHHSAAITEVYAEKDEQQAIKAVMKVG